jgi:hypothetical protein
MHYFAQAHEHFHLVDYKQDLMIWSAWNISLETHLDKLFSEVEIVLQLVPSQQRKYLCMLCSSSKQKGWQ